MSNRNEDYGPLWWPPRWPRCRHPCHPPRVHIKGALRSPRYFLVVLKNLCIPAASADARYITTPWRCGVARSPCVRFFCHPPRVHIKGALRSPRYFLVVLKNLCIPAASADARYITTPWRCGVARSPCVLFFCHPPRLHIKGALRSPRYFFVVLKNLCIPAASADARYITTPWRCGVVRSPCVLFFCHPPRVHIKGALRSPRYFFVVLKNLCIPAASADARYITTPWRCGVARSPCVRFFCHPPRLHTKGALRSPRYFLVVLKNLCIPAASADARYITTPWRCGVARSPCVLFFSASPGTPCRA